MLVLTRRQQEAIHIGDAIVVRVGKVRGGRVTLVIDAPVSIVVRRSELVCPSPEIGEESGGAPAARPNVA
ncbi:MAG: carbon storage regulator [Planctomycetales bacterium]|nr:carbon storage regulator [Planctomycetales bacterium]